MPTATVTLYARQSLDRSGEGAAIDRQLAECRDLCAAKGWQIAEVFTDNDTSATSGKARPGFEALLDSRPQRIVVWHVDRLVRLTKDLERVIDLGVPVHGVKAGHIDLSNPAGRAVARTIVAWSTYEGEQKATRQRAANRQRAQRGDVGWTRRPYGFDRQNGSVALVQAEAAVIRDAATRVLAGEAMGSVVRELNARGVLTSTGARWTVTALRRVLLSPRTAGRVVSKGVDYGEADHGAILDPDTADRLAALLRDPRRRTAPPSTAGKHFLSGTARCGRDGCDDRPMYAVPNPKGVMAYRCLNCYGTRHMELVDKTVLAALVLRLSDPRVVATLVAPDVDLDALRGRVVELRDRRDGLAVMLAEGLLSASVVKEQATRLTEQISDLERQISASTGASPLGRVLGHGDVIEALSRLSLREAGEIVRALATVRILPSGKGKRFDPEQVQIVWR